MIKFPRQLVITIGIIVAAFFLLLYINEQYSKYIGTRDTKAQLEWEAAMDNWAKVHARIAAAMKRDSAATRIIDSARVIAATAIAEANRIRIVRERIPVPATTDSTNPVWQRLYVSAKVENDSLRSAYTASQSALGAALWARDSLRAVLLTADTAGTRVVNAGATAIKASQCRVAWVIPCPSRRLAAVGGFVAGAATVYVATRR
jgi:hypothetical protein